MTALSLSAHSSSVGALFRTGVNYWPAHLAMGLWKNFKQADLHQDFSRMKRAGLDSVRVFLTWEDFQPSPSTINQQALAALVKLMDCAHNCGLEVMPTLFTGHMSGANWLPAWTLGPDTKDSRFRVMSNNQVLNKMPLNWYSDETVRTAQARLARECASALAGHPALLAWDLGNENSNCVVPPDKDSARKWLSAMTGALRSRDRNTAITIGIHMEDLDQDRQLGPQQAAEYCDFLTMHGYPGYAPWAAGPTDERILPYLTQLTRYLGGGRDVFFTEFGVPTRKADESAPLSSPGSGPALVSEEEAASYLGRGLRALAENGAIGAMLWCYADYASELFDQPPFDEAPHERSFGLFRADGSAKPAVKQVSSFIAEGHTVASAPAIADELFIDVTPDEFYQYSQEHLRRLFRRYCVVAENIEIDAN